MPRVPRSALADGYFHAFAQGIPAAGQLFRDDDDRRAFLGLTWMTAREHRWTCYAICVLGTHYHLVLATTRNALSAGFQRLNWLYARHYNAKYGLFGPVLARRFAARSIEGEEYLYDACAYVLLNPVKAGLVDRAEDWPWSYSRHGLLTS
jgi:REP element-mobilizing transposase RayT